MGSERDRLLDLIEELAKSKANDAIKLAFLDNDQLRSIGRLDLTALTGFKRTEKGGIEIQFVDRLAVLKLLVELAGGREEQQAAEFFRAWEKRAGEQEET